LNSLSNFVGRAGLVFPPFSPSCLFSYEDWLIAALFNLLPYPDSSSGFSVSDDVNERFFFPPPPPHGPQAKTARVTREDPSTLALAQSPPFPTEIPFVFSGTTQNGRGGKSVSLKQIFLSPFGYLYRYPRPPPDIGSPTSEVKSSIEFGPPPPPAPGFKKRAPHLSEPPIYLFFLPPS